jgi:hypothetical protein
MTTLEATDITLSFHGRFRFGMGHGAMDRVQ